MPWAELHAGAVLGQGAVPGAGLYAGAVRGAGGVILGAGNLAGSILWRHQEYRLGCEARRQLCPQNVGESEQRNLQGLERVNQLE